MQKVMGDLQPGLGTSSIVGTLTLTKTGTTARVATFPDAAITVARSDAAQTFTGDQTFGTVNATTLDTNVEAAGVTLAGTTLAADGTDADISINITPKGTGSVVQSKVDINGGSIDGTVIGGSSAAAATVTTATVSDKVVLSTATSAGTTAGTIQRETNQDAAYVYNNGIGGWLDKCIFSQYATVTHSGAVTAQSFASETARGTRTLPANFFKQGKVLRFRLCGRYTSDAAAGNATVTILLGGTTLRSTGSFTLDNSSTNQPWIVEGEFSCQTTGATGTLEGVTWWSHGTTGATGNFNVEPMAGTGAITVDTTASAAFDVVWTADDAGTVISCTCFRIWEVC